MAMKLLVEYVITIPPGNKAKENYKNIKNTTMFLFLE
jgi:hypothetical protein